MQIHLRKTRRHKTVNLNPTAAKGFFLAKYHVLVSNPSKISICLPRFARHQHTVKKSAVLIEV